MNKIYVVVLLTSCLSSSQLVNAQVSRLPRSETTTSDNLWKDPLGKWWWNLSSSQIKRRILSEPGWLFDGPKLEEGAAGTTLTVAQATSTDRNTVLMFSFVDDKPYRRAFVYSVGTTAYIEEWNRLLSSLPYDEENSQWIDKGHYANIQRQYVSNTHVMFVVEMSNK